MCDVIRCLLLLGVALAVRSAIVIDDSHVDQHWAAFKKDHNREYATLEEELYRRKVFENSLERVMTHQLAFDRGEETYEKGINAFSDLTFDELSVGDRRVTCDVKRNSLDRANRTYYETDVLTDLGNPPAEKSWSDFVSPIVRNQNIGTCGGCYAFGAVCAIESAWAIKHNKKGQHVPVLSEQQAIDCSKAKKYGNSGCSGGHPVGVYKMVIDKGGLHTSANYPWRQDQAKLHGCHAYKAGKEVKLTAFKEFDRVKDDKKDATLKSNVGMVGPTTASLCISKAWVEYKQGTFQDKDCFKKCLKNSDGINHTVMVTAYKKDFFMIRNSWGTGWGLNGYMKMARIKDGKDTYCNLGSDQSFPLAK